MNESTATHVILGKGAVGTATAGLLAEQGHQVVVLSRSGGPVDPAGRIVHRRVDAGDSTSVREASTGAEVIYNCLNPAQYHRWAELWPPMAEAALDAAEAHGAGLVTISNLYGYGEVDGPITEDHPLDSSETKGVVRSRMWQEALRRHEAGRLRVTEARAADYFGVGVLDTGQLGSRVMPRLLKGKAVRVLGDPDAPHAWSYVADVAATLVALGNDDRSWGRAWHVPSPRATSRRTMVEMLCEAAGVDRVAVGRIPWPVVRTLGVAVPMLAELQGVRYQVDRPFEMDSSRAQTELGLRPTPLPEAVAATVAWWRAGTPDPVSMPVSVA